MTFVRKAQQESGLMGRAGLRVIEFGSFDLNGTPRLFFADAASYTGVDWRPGAGVDVVSLVHEARLPACDVVLCCQMLEHDPFWDLTVRKAVELLQVRGGVLICTWAGPGYRPHELETAPPWKGEGAYYKNLSLDDVSYQLTTANVSRSHTEYQRGTLDALLWARIEPAQIQLRWLEAVGPFGRLIHNGPNIVTIDTGDGTTKWYFSKDEAENAQGRPGEIRPLLTPKLPDGTEEFIGAERFVGPSLLYPRSLLNLLKYLAPDGPDPIEPDPVETGRFRLLTP